MKIAMRFITFLGVLTLLNAQSIDVLRYRIHLYINIPNQYIQGYTEVHFKALQNNLQQVDLMLLKLQVDSIKMGNSTLTYTYNDTVLTITLPAAMNNGDSTALFIYYQGTPQQDASFGGFYFTAAYAYNIGVGMSANPHSFGRVWFPCIDDFRDRAFFEFFITTDSPAVAVCNGLLQQAQNLGNGKTLFHWKLNQPIPPYLASVAVSRYVAVQDTFIGIQDTIPVRLYDLAFDTSTLKSSFVNLPSVFHGYLKWISEFSNYSYSVDSVITNASFRGAFNTGLRVELLPNTRYKLVLDATLMDVFDTGINSFTLGGSFGLPIR